MLEFDEVTIAEDLNTAITKTLVDLPIGQPVRLDPKELQEFYLYYVACSRARKSLLNANCLPMNLQQAKQRIKEL